MTADCSRRGWARPLVHPRQSTFISVTAEDLAQRAFPIARQMRDDHESQAGVRGGVAEKTLKRLQPARRGADTNNRKLVWGRHIEPVLWL